MQAGDKPHTRALRWRTCTRNNNVSVQLVLRVESYAGVTTETLT